MVFPRSACQSVDRAGRPFSLLWSTGQSTSSTCTRCARWSTRWLAGHCSGLQFAAFSLLLDSDLCTISSNEFKKLYDSFLSHLSLHSCGQTRSFLVRAVGYAHHWWASGNCSFNANPAPHSKCIWNDCDSISTVPANTLQTLAIGRMY